MVLVPSLFHLLIEGEPSSSNSAPVPSLFSSTSKEVEELVFLMALYFFRSRRARRNKRDGTELETVGYKKK